MAASMEQESMPGYVQCVQDIYSSISKHMSTVDTDFLSWPHEFYKDLSRYSEITSKEIGIVFGLALLFTVLRHGLTVFLFRPFGRWTLMSQLNQTKFPESAWKTIYYGCAWAASVYYLLIPGKYDYFFRPNHIWEDWKPFLEVPSEIYMIYMVQFSFYLHSVYGTVFMDRWRKDSPVMIFHHFLTMVLIGFSYAARYHKIGMLVLLLHDIADICLEFTKCNVYLKERGNKYYLVHDIISTIGFLGFATSWFVCRLYWFPLKVLHSTGYGVTVYGPEPVVPFYLFFNVMLWLLQGLNIYWFTFIMYFLYKVATGEMKEVDDVREEEVLEKVSSRKKSLPKQAVNGGGESIANGVVNNRKRAKTE